MRRLACDLSKGGVGVGESVKWAGWRADGPLWFACAQLDLPVGLGINILSSGLALLLGRFRTKILKVLWLKHVPIAHFK